MQLVTMRNSVFETNKKSLKLRKFLTHEKPQHHRTRADVSITTHHDQDYISLTDMVKRFGDEIILYGWLRNRSTIEFLEYEGVLDFV